MMKNLTKLLNEVEISDIIGITERVITSIQYDSRRCGVDTLFVAMRGFAADGHRFIENAIKSGSTAIVCEELPDKYGVFKDCTFILVENSRKALAYISRNWFAHPVENMKIIGVTGTNGKTTITFLLKSIFESAGEKCGIIGTTGIFIDDKKIDATHTTPESLELYEHLAQMKEAGVSSIAMEVSSHALHQHRVESVNFSAAAFTNLTHEHLDYHNTIEEYAEAKKILFNSLGSDAVAIVNSDDTFSEFMLDGNFVDNKYLIGRGKNADIKIVDEKLNIDSSEFSLVFGCELLENDKCLITNCSECCHSERIEELKESKNDSDYVRMKENRTTLNIKTNLIGRFNIDNAAMSAALCLTLGYPADIIQKGLLSAKGAPGRMQRIKLKSGAIALVDYAHTPDALEKALLACKDVLKTSGHENSNIICVFGCGGDRDKSKRPIMGKIASELADFAIITSDNPRTEEPDKIIEQIYNGIDNQGKMKTVQITSRLEAIAYAAGLARENDIILVAGKGHENYQIIDAEKQHFDDAEELGKFA